MPGCNEDLLAGLATTPWQPQSLRAKPRESLAPRLRLVVLAAVAGLHLLVTIALMALFGRAPPPVVEDVIVVDFIELPPAPPPDETIRIPLPLQAPERVRAPRRPPQSAAPVAGAPRRPVRDVPMQAVAAPARPLQLYNSDGTLRVPEDMLANIDKEFGDTRTFSYQIPHMDDAKKYFERNPALVYESTRFEQYWTPDADLLTGLLDKLVKATTKEVKMKVPGTAGSYMVCTVSVLAMGGGCGVLTNGADWNGPQDDPATLNPEEDRQCAAWWQQIVGAKTQDAWRATKQRYEQECRKPRARLPSG